MAKSAIEQLADKISKLPNTINKAHAAVVIQVVDKYANEFKNNVEAQTPQGETGELARNIKLKKTSRKGQYGWRLVFDGYNEQTGAALQMIANTLNKGRQAGISDSGRPISKMEGIHFIDSQLEILRQIDPAIEKNMKIGGWGWDDENITLNDGQKLTESQLIEFQRKGQSQ